MSKINPFPYEPDSLDVYPWGYVKMLLENIDSRERPEPIDFRAMTEIEMLVYS